MGAFRQLKRGKEPQQIRGEGAATYEVLAAASTLLVKTEVGGAVSQGPVPHWRRLISVLVAGGSVVTAASRWAFPKHQRSDQ